MKNSTQNRIESEMGIRLGFGIKSGNSIEIERDESASIFVRLFDRYRAAAAAASGPGRASPGCIKRLKSSQSSGDRSRQRAGAGRSGAVICLMGKFMGRLACGDCAPAAGRRRWRAPSGPPAHERPPHDITLAASSAAVHVTSFSSNFAPNPLLYRRSSADRRYNYEGAILC
ncbi:hypothetical protein EVAR_78380_1 [Eumeta japonica]|uniref:Uncharacterized protein n=1 Tax=Eumeta variegata TaxID=151549 RepID=A0A4C1T4A8_EUMVA|nr:hypothetical protein EVAR_78380_1 [Eumeta japonica]